MTTNVYKFPTAKRVDVPLDTTPQLDQPPKRNRWAMAFKVLVVTFTLVRLPLFLVMYWLRLPIMMVCNFLSVGGMFTWILAYFVMPVPKVLWALGILSFVSFVLLWAYDYVLMALSPQPMMQSL